MTSFATRFGVAGMHEEPMGPGLEPIGIPELREMPPRIEQRLLGGVLGEVRVTQDPARHRVQGVADAFDELVERLFVAVHRPLDELAHIPHPLGAGRGRGQSVSMSALARRAFNPRKTGRGETRGRSAQRENSLADLDRVDDVLKGGALGLCGIRAGDSVDDDTDPVNVEDPECVDTRLEGRLGVQQCLASWLDAVTEFRRCSHLHSRAREAR